jgi:REP element-mobilizing transposase RayT
MEAAFFPFDPDAEIEYSERNLPHWFQVGAAMFVTFRCVDSLPREVLLRMQREVEHWLSSKKIPLELATALFASKPPNHQQLLDSLTATDRQEFRKISDRLFHGALDECHGRCALKQPELAKIISNAMLHQNGVAYHLDRFIIMPNHVHAIVQFVSEQGKSIIGQSWMRFSARLINPLINESGAFWQPEPFDHIIRSAEQFVYLQHYVKDNPAKAKLHPGEYLYWQRPE